MMFFIAWSCLAKDALKQGLFGVKTKTWTRNLREAFLMYILALVAPTKTLDLQLYSMRDWNSVSEKDIWLNRIPRSGSLLLPDPQGPPWRFQNGCSFWTLMLYIRSTNSIQSILKSLFVWMWLSSHPKVIQNLCCFGSRAECVWSGAPGLSARIRPRYFPYRWVLVNPNMDSR